jgi:tRNA (cytosine34-C5)-methyltransferase
LANLYIFEILVFLDYKDIPLKVFTGTILKRSLFTMARRGGKKFGKGNKKGRQDDRDDPTRQAEVKTYKDIVRENIAFETYYRAQQLTKSEEEWTHFMDTLRLPLPAAFRINGFCFGQTQALKNLVESKEFGNLTVNSDQTHQDESNIVPLKWYPNGLAYQMRLSRSEIRKSAPLQKLHSFLVSESENGYISRQEAVSMIPPVVLDVQPGHRVLDLCAAPGSKTAQIIEFLHADDSIQFDNIDVAQPDSERETRKPMDGVVVANDVDNGRCYMLVHQSKRLNSPAFIITNHDAGNYYDCRLASQTRSIVMK